MNSRDTSSLKAEALEKLNQRKERLELQDALLTAELSDLEKSDASEIERHIREAQQKKSELQAAREEKNRILSRLAEENVVLEQQIQAQNAEEETVRKDAEKKKTQIALFDSHKKDLEEELSGIIQENNLLAQKINHELNPALQKAREDAGVYREAIGKVQNELQQLTEENESSAALIESLTAKVKEGEAKREEQNRSMEEMTEQYQKVQQDLSRLTEREAETAALQERLKKAMKTAEAMKAQSAELEERTGLKAFTVEQSVANTLEFAEKSLKKLHQSMKEYQAEVNSRLES